MRYLELYIENQRLELLDDESVVITDSIQNIKDISKVFTAYSQQFNLPASKTNSKIFKHYYNSDIINGLDSRFQLDAEIKLNSVTFKKGKIRLDGVSMKDNKAHTYKVTFFGETIELNEILKGDFLNTLTYLDQYDHRIQDINNGLKTGLGVNGALSSNKEITYPLISVNEEFYYETGGVANDLNLALTDFNGVHRNLKPAVKMTEIINAIEDRYDITFSSDFFGSDIFDKLYLWGHKEKGGLRQTMRGGRKLLSDYTLASGTEFRPLTTDSNTQYQINLIFAISNPFYATTLYNCTLEDITTNEVVFQGNAFQGNQTSGMILLESDESRTWDLRLKVWSNDAWGMSLQTFKVNEVVGGVVSSPTNYTSTDFTLPEKVFIIENLPKIKIIDFLTNLFKVFNLTAYIENDIIVVKTLDDYMSSGTEFDITKYIDTAENKIARVVPYSTVDFMYSEVKTKASSDYLDDYEITFGNYNFASVDKFEGQNYELKIDFEHTLLVAMQNNFNGAETGIVQGRFVDKENTPIIGRPYIFFNRNVDLFPLTALGSTTINCPANVTENGNHTINFDSEFDEYTGQTNTNSLFQKFYKQYIENGFSKRARIESYEAYLPTNVLLNYNLNDTMIIGNKKYSINSIKTNLLTGKSNLELISKFKDVTPSVLN